MTTNAQVQVRPAVADDAAGIAAVHHAAVHNTGAGTYPPDVLQHWSGPLNDARIDRVQTTITDSNEHVLVAESEGAIVGFGSIVLSEGLLHGTYVTPHLGRSGIGGRLQGALEEFATEHGVSQLVIYAALNAERFYATHGFEKVEMTTRQLDDGFEIPAIQMQKTISSR